MALSYYLPCLWAFAASLAFCVFFNIHGKGMFICALGGALGWLAYLLAAPVVQNEIVQTFLAAILIAAYSELMARIRKCPVTGYLLVAFFPLVPGGGIYHAMEYALRGEVDRFIETGLQTLGIAGALAAGVLLVSSAVRMYTVYHSKP